MSPERTCPSCDAPLTNAARFCSACGTATPPETTPVSGVVFTAPALGDATALERLNAALAGRYRVKRELGHGGMATVYLAEDLRHRREVAVKVLRPELAAALGSERFLREIEIAARLAHPHILPVHDSGEAQGFLFYVMPFIEGGPLRARLAREGELPVRDAIRLIREIADALSYAHARGVIHRDVKPDNVMLSGRHALVADFGVAKALYEAAAGDRLTTAGVSLGTPTYMAPEQAMADPHVDHRADIYALGVLAYELLTGSPPFAGDSAQAVLMAHVTEEVTPITDRRASIPPAIAQLVMKCLRKKSADRWQTADEIVHQLEALGTPSAGTTPVRAITPALLPRRPVGVIVAAGLAVLALGLGWWALGSRRAGGTGATASYQQVTFTGDVVMSALSPDGRYVAFVRPGADGEDQLFVQEVRGGRALALVSHPAIRTIQWSGDGTEVLFMGGDPSGVRAGFAVPLLGGAARRAGPEWPGQPGRRADRMRWSRDGSRLAAWGMEWKRLALHARSAGDSTILPLNGTFDWVYDVDWPPGDGWLAVLTVAGQRWTILAVSLDGRGQQVVVADSVPISSLHWSPDGNAIYYLRSAGPTQELWKIPVSSKSGRPEGAATRVLSGLEPAAVGGRHFTIGANGRRLLFTREASRANLALLALDPAQRELAPGRTLTSGTSFKSWPRVSPDGVWLAFTDTDPSGTNLFKVSIAGGPPEQLTFGSAWTISPVWSPDGAVLAFGATEGTESQLWSVPAGGGTPRRYRQTAVSQQIASVAWSPATSIFYQRPGNRNWHVVDVSTEAEATLVANDSVGWMFALEPSPGSDRVAAFWNRRPEPGIWIITLSDSSQRLLVPGRMLPVRWTARADALYAHDPETNELHLVSVSNGAMLRSWKLPPECSDVDVTPDGRQAVCQMTEVQRDLWLVEDFDPDVQRGN